MSPSLVVPSRRSCWKTSNARNHCVVPPRARRNEVTSGLAPRHLLHVVPQQGWHVIWPWIKNKPKKNNMGVEPKIGGKPPKSSILIGFSLINYKPSILGYPYFWKHPYLRLCLRNLYDQSAPSHHVTFSLYPAHEISLWWYHGWKEWKQHRFTAESQDSITKNFRYLKMEGFLNLIRLFWG